MYFDYKKIKRGRLNEQLLNKYFNDISHDIMDQYGTLDNLTESINILKNISNNNISITNKISEAIDAFIENINTNTGESIYTNTLYDSSNIFLPDSIDNTLHAEINTEYGIATCGVASSTRVLTGISNNGVILTSTARNHITRIIENNTFDTRADEIIENDIINAIDPQSNLPYLLVVSTTNPNIDRAGLTISLNNINFPANTFKIKPFPIIEQTINTISLNTESGNTLLPKPDGSFVSFPIESANNLITTFKETTINDIVIQISNPNKSVTIPYKFILGVMDISLEYNEYYNKSYVGFRFVVPKNNSNEYKKIKEIIFDWTFIQDMTKAYIYKAAVAANGVTNGHIDMISSDGKIYDTPLEINEDYVYIVVELNKLPTGASPMIKSCAIKFI